MIRPTHKWQCVVRKQLQGLWSIVKCEVKDEETENSPVTKYFYNTQTKTLFISIQLQDHVDDDHLFQTSLVLLALYISFHDYLQREGCLKGNVQHLRDEMGLRTCNGPNGCLLFSLKQSIQSSPNVVIFAEISNFMGFFRGHSRQQSRFQFR